MIVSGNNNTIINRCEFNDSNNQTTTQTTNQEQLQIKQLQEENKRLQQKIEVQEQLLLLFVIGHEKKQLQIEDYVTYW